MTELEKLKQRIIEAIHTNAAGEITGQVLQDTLLDMVDSISENVNLEDYLTVDASEAIFNGISNHFNELGNALSLKADKAQIVDDDDAVDQHNAAMTMYASYSTFATRATTYTKEEVDQAIENIDVTGQLATVATTGDYDDLTNKPTLQARVEGETLILSL